ncbi:MAG: sigma-70 family RNA polymerase sigma factor [Planctomycetes bacterium]|nr:sigma-70 family RNA polymerase sigma factor [Planctomycetota bacterium]
MSLSDPKMKLFTRCWTTALPAVSAYILAATRDATDTEDLVHDVAQSALEHLDTYDTSRPFDAWVLGIARNRILNHFRSRRRDRHVFGEPALIALAAAYEGIDHHKEAMQLALEHCTGSLPANQRQLLEKRYRDEVPVQDIAASSNTTPHAVSNALHRIRQKLAECVRRQMSAEGGVTHG